MSAVNTLPKRSSTSALLPKASPASASPSAAPVEEKKKSKNPFKFLKSHSHHPDSAKKVERQRAHTISKAESPVNHHIAQPIKRSQTAIKTIPPKKIDTSHLSNPFSKSATDNFSHIGTGSDIAAPRNSISASPLSRAPSFKDPKMVYNPYGINSRTPSQYSINSVSDEEKKNILPLPIQDPNQELPEEFKQDFSALNDEFLIPEKGSAKDKKLGDGASASVLLVQNKKTLKSYALKKFCLLPHEQADQFYKRATKEFIIAKKLSHNKHIAQTYYLVKIQTTINITRGWGFILEYCKGGDLFGLISRTGWRSYPLNEKFCVFKQLVLGVKFMHSQGIVHRDLKPENVLINENGIVKLTDFGVAEYGLENPNDLTSGIKFSSSFVGSPPYVSPEVMNLKLPNNHEAKYDPFKLDLWAVGLILFCLAYQGTPFRVASTTDNQYRDYIIAYSTYLSSNPSFKFGDKNHGPGSEFKYAKEFQSTGASRVAWRLCDPDPQTRYTLKDIFEDPWFIGIEICCDENESDYVDDASSTNGSIPGSEKERVGSFDSNNYHSSVEHSRSNSTRISPIIKPKSMLDLLSNEPTIPLTNDNNITAIAESGDGEENITNGNDKKAGFFIQDQSSNSQQALPPLQEAEDESVSAPVSAPMTTTTSEVEFKLNSLELNKPNNSSSSDQYEDAQEPKALPKLAPLTINNNTSTNSNANSNNITTSPKVTTTSPLVMPSTPHTSSPLASTSPQNSVITPMSISQNMQRASSISSLASTRSMRSNSNSSIGLNRRKRVHHHLDITNVSNHGFKK